MTLVTELVGPWSFSKLSFLSDYLTAFSEATSKVKGKVSYLDLFAGTGRVENKNSGEERDGSPVIAARLFPNINHLVLCDIDEVNIASVNQRVASLVSPKYFETILGDSNDHVSKILANVPEVYGAAFAFLDPHKHNLKWSTVKVIADHKRKARYKIELFILFPFHMAINRVLGSRRTLNSKWPDQESVVDSVMPDDWRWKALLDQQDNGEITREQFRHRFVFLYWQGLRELGYSYVPNPKLITTPKGLPLYTLIFASDHSAGNRIMEHVLHKQIRFEETMPMPLMSEPWNFSDTPDWYTEL
ncbi:MAG: three-Cys-motif partner protein TcmP [Chloroflexi bacterium]|nr:three-Cys-motif partner protein TcmP [Chloroflexota bacterium]